MRDLYNDIGETGVDGLIAGPRFPIAFKGITVASGQGVLKRGTALGIKTASGKAVLLNSANTTTIPPVGDGNPTIVPDGNLPDCVLAEDIDATNGDVTAIAYSAGYFVRGKLIFGGNDTWETHELEMRKLNMHMSASIDAEGGVK
ncbi:hypothetical protein FACS1894216_02520 [Synergistales bacterium]|nr:hypothetical protein FACS1894216_02520 [Synergistales bacterium]